MKRFHNRNDAGKQLAHQLAAYKNRTNVVVLGIVRGGIVVAAEIAQALDARFDIFIAHKIGAPFNSELAIGAVTGDGTVFLDEPLIRELRLSEAQVAQARDVQIREIQRRTELFRRNAPPLALQNKIVILADDGVATGSTTIAALRALKQQNPQRVILAVPVAPPQVVPLLRAECDEIVVLKTPDPFAAVGYFYDDFEQVTDAEVLALLHSQE